MTVSTSLVRRRQRWDHSLLQSTSTSDSDDTSGESSTQNKGDDNMKLRLNGEPDSDVVIAQSQSHAVPVSSTDPPTPPVEAPSVRSSLRLLFGMTRPSNFPGVVLLHVLGVYLALQSPYVEKAQLLSTLARPSMMVVLACLILTTAASMVVCRLHLLFVSCSER